MAIGPGRTASDRAPLNGPPGHCFVVEAMVAPSLPRVLPRGLGGPGKLRRPCWLRGLRFLADRGSPNRRWPDDEIPVGGKG